MSLKIVTYPDSGLLRPSEEITEITAEIRDLAAAMTETMYADSGLGLAAPQVGVNRRLIVVDVSGPDLRTGLKVMVNPRIVAQDGETTATEGCLSFPELTVKITRAKQIRVQGLDLDGQEQTIDAEGLLAVCFQHELDHLEGRLILDYASQLKRSLYEKKVKRWQKRDAMHA